MISEKFQTTCTADHVENHMRTVRSTWGIISQVRGRSGFGWDDNVKMVTAYPNAYHAYVQVHMFPMSLLSCICIYIILSLYLHQLNCS